ncbi:hypothetical protein [Litoribrevibacter albus]|uniref:Uncharacterized protein n=1 Tax=Litoribrevibacter albus TaxID=1473156 RepID=A0AA37SEF1_9GAMM|nr:hypothetical protein [Litoribrevibacter albus]GLQ33006.1 hypothetical protein GCM10007876_34850 [Litoribrevibacter albus]
MFTNDKSSINKQKDSSIPTDIISNSNDIRELIWLYHELFRSRPYRPVVHVEARDEYFQAINEELLSRHFNSIEDRNFFVNDVRSKCRKSLVPDHALSWIGKKDERLSLWLWFRLRSSEGLEFSSEEVVSQQTRYRKIVTYFDRLEVPRAEKLRIISDLNKQWSTKCSFSQGHLSWLVDGGKELGLWAVKYLKKRDLVGDCYFCAPEILVHFKSPSQQAITIMDQLELPLEDLTVLVEKMHRAWVQKASRDRKVKKLSGTKLKVSKGSLAKLNEISEFLGHNDLNRTINSLIDTQYAILKSGWKK